MNVASVALAVATLAQLPDLVEFRSAKSPAAAAEIAARIDRDVQQGYLRAMKASAANDADDVLRALPEDIDGFWVSREPFEIQPALFLSGIDVRPSIQYAAELLMSIDQGRFGRNFHGRMVRTIAGATRGATDIAYFCFFDGPVDPALLPRDALGGYWISQPKPGLLVFATTGSFLQSIVERMRTQTKVPPATRPEWPYIDRTASLWGFRKGVAVSFDEASKEIVVHFLQPPGRGVRSSEFRAYTVSEPAPGITRFAAHIKDGVGPIQPAAQRLGFPLHPSTYRFVSRKVATESVPVKAAATAIARDLESALQQDDWRRASALSRQLVDATAATLRSSATADTAVWNARILNWMPGGVETVIAAGSPFVADQATMIHGLPLMLLAMAGNGAVLKELTGQTIVAAVMSGWKFNEPISAAASAGKPTLGLQPFRGCGVYVFASEPPPPVRRAPDDKVLGFSVWTTPLSPPRKGSVSILVTTPTTWIVCNDVDLLRDLAARATGPAEPSREVLPPSLPLWKYVDRSAPVWGVSRYSGRATAALALLTPGPIEASGATIILTPTSAKLRMLASANPWKDGTQGPPLNGASKTTEIAPGVWELSIQGDAGALQMVPLLALPAMQFLVFI